MSLEGIVRPFESRDVFLPARVATVPGEGDGEEVVLMFGQEGTLKTMTGSGSTSQTSFQKKETKELSRETKERRVENPDDPDQYVMVEDTTKIEVESGKLDTYEQQSIEFKDQEGA